MNAVVAAAITEAKASLRPIAEPAPVTGFGRDVQCVRDLSPALTDVEGTALLGQDLFHRLDTDRGALPDDKDYGLDLAGMLSAPVSATEILTLQTQIENELAKDDRVADAECTITESARGDYRIEIRVTPEDPEVTEFTMLVSVTDGALLLEALR